MFKLYRALLTIIFTVGCVVAYGAAAKVEFTDPSNPIIVAHDSPLFTIRLQSNPTTGYSWFTQSIISNTLTLVSHTYFPPAKNLPGAPGYEEWVYKINTDKSAVKELGLNMIYAQPWNLKAAKLVKFKIKVQ